MNKHRIIKKPLGVTSPALQNSPCYVPPELQKIIHMIRARSSDSILRHSQLRSKCGRAPSTIHADIVSGVFPPGFAIGPRATGYSANEIDAWISACLYASRNTAHVNMKAFIALLVESRELVVAQERTV
jgi:predicted DNA-binding transcriptional regulator AlpA